jgi:hypothetical protein
MFSPRFATLYANLSAARGFTKEKRREIREKLLRNNWRNSGRRVQEEELDAIHEHFDADYYLVAYPDVKAAGTDPLRHFVKVGWREGRNPNASFNTRIYALFNSVTDVNPFYHYIKYGQSKDPSFAHSDSLHIDYVSWRAPHRMQDITFPRHIENAESLIVVIVPEHNEMSGGIYSFFSIARVIYNTRHKHGYEVVLMTRPNTEDITYLRQSNFRNSEDVFRFEQIERCKRVKDLQIYIPEYATRTFWSLTKESIRYYIKSREKTYINILNQNILLMPEKEEFEKLRHLARELTQTVAHHAYFTQAFADRYELPTLLLPPYTDLSGYEKIDFKEKEKLIIYSPDDYCGCRNIVLDKLKKGLPDYRLVEIFGIRFDEFMSLASRCMFSISFGEGFDGYIAQPIHQGGIGFAVYRKEFFPFEEMKSFANIFESEDDMVENIVERICRFASDEKLYRKTNNEMMKSYDKLYSKDDYIKRVLKLVNREFELFPGELPRHNIGFSL